MLMMFILFGELKNLYGFEMFYNKIWFGGGGECYYFGIFIGFD